MIYNIIDLDEHILKDCHPDTLISQVKHYHNKSYIIIVNETT